jgi:hypothetical protein
MLLSPLPEPQCASPSIVLHRRRYVKLVGQLQDRIPSLPERQGVHVAQFARQRIHRSSAADADAGDLHAVAIEQRPERGHQTALGISRSIVGQRRNLTAGKHLPCPVNQSQRNLGSTNIERGDNLLILMTYFHCNTSAS